MPEGEAATPSSLLGKLKRWAIRLLVFGAIGILVGAICVGVVLFYFNSTLPPLHDLSHYAPPQVTRLTDRHGTVVAELFKERRTVVPFNQIPKHVRQAFLAAEDAEFYQHQGLDFPGLLRAFWANLKAGRVVQGGSTITQQVIKTFVLGPERSYSRKIRELLLAFKLESNLTKDEILYLYLNQIYFGHGRYGVQEASRFYFDKDVADLDLAEGAMLASLPKSPSGYSPVRHPKRARKRRDWVLGQMARNEMAASTEVEKAKREPLVVAAKRVDFQALAPYYAEHCRRLLEEQLGTEKLLTGGLRIELALDLQLQTQARRAVQDGLRAVDRRQGYRGPLGRISTERLAQLRAAHQAALDQGQWWSLAEKAAEQDRPKTWEASTTPPAAQVRLVVPVVAIQGEGKQAVAEVDLGGRRADLDLKAVSWARPFSPVKWTAKPKSVSDVLSPLDVVEVTVSSVGSGGAGPEVTLSQPPLVQAALVAIDPHSRHVMALVGGSDFARTPLIRAVQSHRQPGSAFKPIVYTAAIDAGLVTPSTILMDSPEVYKHWKPKNYEREFRGPVSVRFALAHSINTIAVKLAYDLGPGRVIEMAQTLGIESDLQRNLSLALGSSEVTPLELTNAYATFAAGGKLRKPIFVTRIEGPEGPMPLEDDPERQVIRPEVAYVVSSLLRSVVEEGTGRKALKIKRPLAGKTGTANGQRDGWFVGFSPQMACGVWVGFDDHSRMGRGWATGSGTALPIWVQFMDAALDEAPVSDFRAPPGVVFARVDPENGLLAPPRAAGAVFETFVAGTEPRSFSTRIGELATDGQPVQGEQQDGPLGRLPDDMFR